MTSVLFAAVASLNGLKNQEATYAGVTQPDPNFLRVLELFRTIQLSGGVAPRIQQDSRKQEAMLITMSAQ